MEDVLKVQSYGGSTMIAVVSELLSSSPWKGGKSLLWIFRLATFTTTQLLINEYFLNIIKHIQRRDPPAASDLNDMLLLPHHSFVSFTFTR